MLSLWGVQNLVPNFFRKFDAPKDWSSPRRNKISTWTFVAGMDNRNLAPKNRRENWKNRQSALLHVLKWWSRDKELALWVRDQISILSYFYFSNNKYIIANWYVRPNPDGRKIENWASEYITERLKNRKVEGPNLTIRPKNEFV